MTRPGKMQYRKFGKQALGIFLLLITMSCSQNFERKVDAVMSKDESMIRQVHADYVEGWKTMDEHKVLGLLEEKSQIQPNKFDPVIGKENTRSRGNSTSSCPGQLTRSRGFAIRASTLTAYLLSILTQLWSQQFHF
ncbi:MAG: hypothetical protein HKN39_01925 [Flavobacteriales bacterium]|nr:hypothetical protein [Flavobacteriales bacterium]